MVGIEPAPYWLKRQEYPESIGRIEPNAVFVWKQKQDKPSHKLTVPSTVLWAEFVTNDRLALYLAGEKASLQIWDVGTGKSVTTISLSAENDFWFIRRLWMGKQVPQPAIVWQHPVGPAHATLSPIEHSELRFLAGDSSHRTQYALRTQGFYDFAVPR